MNLLLNLIWHCWRCLRQQNSDTLGTICTFNTPGIFKNIRMSFETEFGASRTDKGLLGGFCYLRISGTIHLVSERVVDHLLLMTYGLKLSLEAWILKLKKKSLNNLRFNELQLNFGNSNFFVKLRYVICIFTNSRFKCKL